MSNFNSKSYLYSSMVSPSFSPYPATMHHWKKEALKYRRQELGRVQMDVGMIRNMEKSVTPSPDNIGFLGHEQLYVVQSKRTPADQMNTIIDYLLEMEDKYFEDFCTILERSNFELQANMLRKTAEDLKRSVGKLEYKQHTCMCSNIIKTSCM